MKKKENSKKQSDSNLIPESKENIRVGAKVFSKKASDIFGTFLEKVKGAAEIAYDKGSEIVEGVSLTAQNYVDEFKDRSEMSNVKKVRDEVATQLGNMCYLEYSGRYRFRKEFMKSEEFKNLIAQIRELDKQIIKIGERLKSE
jgi:hypothetical protein